MPYTPRYSVLLLLAAAVGIGLLGACQQPSTSDVDQTEEGVLRLGSVEAVDSVARAVALNDRPLVIEGFRGAVALTGTPDGPADLQFIRRGRGEDAETARGVLENVSVTESGSEDAYTYTLETDSRGYAAIDVTGTLPEQAAVELKRSSGSVSLDGIRGALTVTHDNGPVTLRGTAASVSVEVKNGDVAVHAQAVPPDASINLQSQNGDLTLRLPPDAALELDAQTNAGDIRTQGLSMTEEEFVPREAGGQYTAQLGAGDASATLQTQNGSILITALDTATAPPQDPASPSVPPSDTTVSPGSSDTTTTRPDTAASGAMPMDTTASDTSSS